MYGSFSDLRWSDITAVMTCFAPTYDVQKVNT